MIPEPALASYRQTTSRAGFVARDDRGWIVVSGKDRAPYLHGLFTNDIASLSAGRGCYAAYLTAQGRMIADLWVYELGDVILLSTSRDVKDTLLAKLDQFIFSEDVQLGDATASFAVTTVLGPEAAPLVAPLVGSTGAVFEGLPEHGNLRVSFGADAAIALRVSDYGVPGYDVLVDVAREPDFRAALTSAGVTALDPAAADALRIEAGVPKFHRDMDEETIPLEAGIESRAISLTKGCYVGQEVIIRVLHRGHGRVARKLVGLLLEGDDAAAVGSAIRAGDRDIGTVTSSTWSPRLSRPIALGYVHRDFQEPGASVSVADRPAIVHKLPFVE
jgi:folate-binding protein YgfZ